MGFVPNFVLGSMRRKADGAAVRRQSPWGDLRPDEMSSRIDAACHARQGQGAVSRAAPVLFMRFGSVAASELAGLLPEGRRSLGACSVADAGALPFMATVLVHAEGFDDLDDVVTAMMGLRQERPDLTVVLASSAVRGDDLSLERSSICDATLRLPARAASLARVLDAAAENAQIRRQAHH